MAQKIIEDIAKQMRMLDESKKTEDLIYESACRERERLAELDLETAAQDIIPLDKLGMIDDDDSTCDESDPYDAFDEGDRCMEEDVSGCFEIPDCCDEDDEIATLTLAQEPESADEYAMLVQRSFPATAVQMLNSVDDDSEVEIKLTGKLGDLKDIFAMKCGKPCWSNLSESKKKEFSYSIVFDDGTTQKDLDERNSFIHTLDSDTPDPMTLLPSTANLIKKNACAFSLLEKEKERRLLKKLEKCLQENDFSSLTDDQIDMLTRIKPADKAKVTAEDRELVKSILGLQADDNDVIYFKELAYENGISLEDQLKMVKDEIGRDDEEKKPQKNIVTDEDRKLVKAYLDKLGDGYVSAGDYEVSDDDVLMYKKLAADNRQSLQQYLDREYKLQPKSKVTPAERQIAKSMLVDADDDSVTNEFVAFMKEVAEHSGYTFEEYAKLTPEEQEQLTKKYASYAKTDDYKPNVQTIHNMDAWAQTENGKWYLTGQPFKTQVSYDVTQDYQLTARDRRIRDQKISDEKAAEARIERARQMALTAPRLRPDGGRATWTPDQWKILMSALSSKEKEQLYDELVANAKEYYSKAEKYSRTPESAAKALASELIVLKKLFNKHVTDDDMAASFGVNHSTLQAYQFRVEQRLIGAMMKAVDTSSKEEAAEAILENPKLHQKFNRIFDEYMNADRQRKLKDTGDYIDPERAARALKVRADAKAAEKAAREAKKAAKKAAKEAAEKDD